MSGVGLLLLLYGFRKLLVGEFELVSSGGAIVGFTLFPVLFLFGFDWNWPVVV